MSEPLISVIIPVYNVEEYIERCITSILTQTYKNLEIILVNVGSTDRSGEICEAFAKTDSRIVVMHEKKCGPGGARNIGIQKATGDYFVCVDSDDYVKEDYVAYLYELLIENEADISTCSFKKIYHAEETLDEVSEKITIYHAEEALEQLIYQKNVQPCVYCKLYKRELFEEISFPEMMQYEDLAIIYKLLEKADKIAASNQQKYYYIQRRNSIMNEKFNKRKMQRIRVANDLKLYVDEKYPALTAATSVRCFLAGVQVFREVPKKKEYQEYLGEAWEQVRKYRRFVLKDRKAKFSIRLIAFSTYAGKTVLSMLSKCYSGVFVERKRNKE